MITTTNYNRPDSAKPTPDVFSICGNVFWARLSPTEDWHLFVSINPSTDPGAPLHTTKLVAVQLTGAGIGSRKFKSSLLDIRPVKDLYMYATEAD